MSAPDTSPKASNDGMFAAYLEIKRRSPWPWVLLVLALVAVVVVGTRTAPRAIYQIEVKGGVMTLHDGMPAAEVEKKVGHAIASERVNGLDCRSYGHPEFDKKFWVYAICYDGDRLVSLHAAQLQARRIQNLPQVIPVEPAPGP